MGVRPEPTQLEHLSDASFLGKLLVLPANVRLDWKVIARYKCSSLLGLVVIDEGKKFYKIATWSSKGKKATSTGQVDLNFVGGGLERKQTVPRLFVEKHSIY